MQTDWDAIAKQLGYKDAGVARTRWGQIKRKKFAATTGRVSKGSPNKKTATAPKSAADGAEEGTPTKAKRGRKPKAKATDATKVKNEEVEDEADAVETTEQAGVNGEEDEA